MRKKMYPYNREEVRKNQRLCRRRKMKRTVCAMTLTAVVLSSIPVGSTLPVYAQNVSDKSVDADIKNAVTYDLSDPSLITSKKVVDYYGKEQEFYIIDINITEDGTYRITGSNEINGAYMDTHIRVAEGVTADLIFDGVRIENDDIYCKEVDTCGRYYVADVNESLFPLLEIAGTANIYTEEDSVLEMQAGEMVADVTGTMCIKESENDAVLKILAGIEGVAVGTSWSHHGKLEIQGGYLETTGSVGMESDYCVLSEIEISGGSLSDTTERYMMRADHIRITGGKIKGKILDNYVTYMGAEKTLEISGGEFAFQSSYDDDTCHIAYAELYGCLTGGSFAIGNANKAVDTNITDASGKCVAFYTLDGLPENASISKINGHTVSDTKTNADGTLCTALPAENALVEINGSPYLYQYDKATSSFAKSEALAVYQVTFVSDGNTVQTMQAAEGSSIGVPFEDALYMDYSYQAEDGSELDQTTAVTKDMTVTFHKTAVTHNVEIKETGETLSMTYTDRLPAGYLYFDRAHYVIYTPEDPVTSDISLDRIPVVEENGEEWVQVSTTEDMETAGKILCEDPYLNIRLMADLDYTGLALENKNYDYGLLGTYTYNYYGTFDGKGHCISDMSMPATGMAEMLYGTIRNLHLKNVTLSSEKNWAAGCGIICSANYGTIENCYIENATLTTKAAEEDEIFAEKGVFAGSNHGTIRNCFSSGSSLLGDGNRYPVAKNMGGVIENTYYVSPEATEDGGVTAEYAAAGELCYLLNQNKTEDAMGWYQNINGSADADAYPVLDKTHGIVYKGYQGCKTVFTNDQDSITEKPVHDLTYSSKDNVITAVCKEDDSHTAEVSLLTEDAEYDGTAHKAELSYSDAWKKFGMPEDLKICYERNGEQTEDLTTEGTITATLSIGDVSVKKTYTITKKQQSEGGSGGSTNGNVEQNTRTDQDNKEPAQNNTPADTEKTNAEKTNTEKADTDKIAKGSKVTDKKGNVYKVTNVKKKEVTFVKPKKGCKGTLTIPAIIKIKGKTYKVTSISENACKDNKKIRKVVIGANINKIGKKAFYGCSKLKTVTIKTTKLTKKSIGKKAFDKIAKNVTIKASSKIKKLI